MASNLNVVLSSAILQVILNSDSSARVNSNQASPTLAAAEASYIDFFPVAAGGGSVMPLVAATVWVLAIRNLGGQNGSPAGNITVQAQPVGGALPSAANSPIVLPGGVYIYWQTAETAGGIVAVTLVASIAATPVEFLSAA